MDERERMLEAMRAFIVEEVLGGEGDDLTNETPLLETGIIDSFTLVSLVSFINDRFGCSLVVEELVPENLENLQALATFLVGCLQPAAERTAQ
jgi:acyl carrier protein